MLLAAQRAMTCLFLSYIFANTSFALTLPSHGNISTLAGTGSAGYSGDGGAATSAELSYPSAVAVDASGNLYIADTSNSRVRKVSYATGIVTTIAGNGNQGYSGDGGAATAAELSLPTGIAVDTSGNVYVADNGNGAIRVINSSTQVITSLVSGFDSINDVALDGFGNIYFSDPFENSIYKAKISSGAVTTAAGSFNRGYSGDGGAATSAELASPQGIALDASGNLYIADEANSVVREVSAASGLITTVAGQGNQGGFSGDTGTATSALLNAPNGVAVDQEGNLFISDGNNARIREVVATTGIINTVVGGGSSLSNNIADTSALLAPAHISFDKLGNLYIADEYDQLVRAVGTLGSVTAPTPFQFPQRGYITTLAGSGHQGYAGDAGAATDADLSYPQGVFAFDTQGPAGLVFVADTDNNRIRVVNLATSIITTLVGNGQPGYTGDSGLASASELDQPVGIGEDSTGALYIADTQNGAIRKVSAPASINYSASTISSLISGYVLTNDVAYSDNVVYFTDPFENAGYQYSVSTGDVTTAAGSFNRGYSGDGGPATSAELASPQGFALSGGTFTGAYLADVGNSVIRGVNEVTGNISTVAGNGTVGFAGDGGPATSASLANPVGVAVDAAGNLYIADNNRIREVSISTGIINTVVGNGVCGFAGDGGPALNAELCGPSHIAFDESGNLYIADTQNQRIRVVAGLGAVPTSPTISSLSPTFGDVGTTVNISGSNFGATQGASKVTIDGTVASVSSWSASSVTITVPSGARTGSLIVTVGSIASNAVTFTVISPSITLSPTSGPVGTTITIYGTGFGATQAGSTVSFNGTEVATYSSWSATSIVVEVPVGATTGFVSLTIAGVSETGPNFTVSGNNLSQAYSYIAPLAGGYDPAGNLLQYVDSVMGTWNFKYDSLNRLYSAVEAATPPGSSDNSYTGQNLCMYYDSFGNRTQYAWQTAACPVPTLTAPNPTTTYNADNHQTNNFYQYDAAGNAIYDGVNWYAYDGDGRLCAVQSMSMNGGGMSAIGYLYDAEGRRVAKGKISSSSTMPLPASMCNAATNGFTLTESYLLGPSNEELTTLDWAGSTSTWVRTNVFGGAMLLGTYDNDGLHFHLTDPLGTRRVQTNQQGSPEQNCQSLPYGDRQNCFAAGTASGTNSTPLLFTGKERDAESGLDYFGARYYGASMGRFMSPDWSQYPNAVPYADLANPQSLNLYAYVNNNPLRYRDADGHTHQECAPDTSSTDSNGTVTVTAGACHDVPDWWNFGTRFNNWWQTKVVQPWNARIDAHQAPPQKPDDPDAALRAITDAMTIGTGLPNARAAASRLNKLNHVFDPKHNLEPLVREFGSQEGAMQAIEKAAADQLGSNISGDGQVVQVGKYNVTVTGGSSPAGPQVGNAWIPGPGQAGPP